MFLRQLSSSGSSFLPRCRAASSHLPFRRAPHPWWSAWGFPPWPPRPPCPLPQATSSSINPVRSLYTRPALLMERPDRDREPPHKRRKCAEEKRSVEEREGHRGGAVGGETGGSKRQQQEHPDSNSDSRPRPKQRFKEWSRERGHSEAGRCVSKENGRDKDGGGWTRTRRDQTTDRGRSAQQRGEAEDPQPARTRTRPSEPEQGNVPLRGHNAWFQEPEGRGSDRSSEGGQWTGLLSRQAAGADGTPVRPPNDKPPAKCEFCRESLVFFTREFQYREYIYRTFSRLI